MNEPITPFRKGWDIGMEFVGAMSAVTLFVGAILLGVYIGTRVVG